MAITRKRFADEKTDDITRTCAKPSPNFLTNTDAPSEGQKVGDTDLNTFCFSASKKSIHCSALTAADT